MSQKFVVIDSQGAAHHIFAERLVVERGDVELVAEGGKQVGFFVKPVSVVAEQVPEATASPSSMFAAGCVELAAGEVALLDQSPRVEIGAINITVTGEAFTLFGGHSHYPSPLGASQSDAVRHHHGTV